MTLGERLKKARGDKSLRQLADRTGLNSTTLHNVESGRQKSLKDDKIERIAQATGYRKAWLMFGEEPERSGSGSLLPPARSGEHMTSTRVPSARIDEQLAEAISALDDGEVHPSVIEYIAMKRNSGEIKERSAAQWVRLLLKTQQTMDGVISGMSEYSSHSRIAK